jgi:hypothetical protein
MDGVAFGPSATVTLKGLSGTHTLVTIKADPGGAATAAAATEST